MSDASQPRLESGHEAEGKPAAFIAWGLTHAYPTA